MSGPFKNFDDFDQEASAKPIAFRVLGKKWELPPTAPAKQILRIQKVQAAIASLQSRDPEEELTSDEVRYMREAADGFDLETEARALIGDDLVDTWFEQGLPFNKFVAIFWWLVGVYQGTISADAETDEEDGEQEGEAEAPEPGAPSLTSLETGPSSRQISSVSTG